MVRYTRGSGPGGQHKNKVETCCYIKHIPTKIEVKADGRSKTKNYQVALKELNRRLGAILNKKEMDYYRDAKNKCLEIGTIRTYNFVRGTVKDHRSNITAPLKKVLNGNIDLLK